MNIFLMRVHMYESNILKHYLVCTRTHLIDEVSKKVAHFQKGWNYIIFSIIISAGMHVCMYVCVYLYVCVNIRFPYTL